MRYSITTTVISLVISFWLTGCTSIKDFAWLIESEYFTGGHVANGFLASGSDGAYELRSVSRMPGNRLENSNWSLLKDENRQIVLIGLNIELQASGEKLEEVRAFLNHKNSECSRPLDKLNEVFQLTNELLKNWSPQLVKPTLVIRLLATEQGISFREYSNGKLFSELRMHLAQNIVQSKSCSGIQEWASDLGMLLIHELSHMAYFQKGYVSSVFNRDTLGDELQASAAGFCFYHVFNKQMPTNFVVVSGLDFNKDDLPNDPSFKHALETKVINNSVAGTLLAYNLPRRVFGTRALTADDIPMMLDICKRAQSKKINAYSQTDIDYIYPMKSKEPVH